MLRRNFNPNTTLQHLGLCYNAFKISGIPAVLQEGLRDPVPSHLMEMDGAALLLDLPYLSLAELSTDLLLQPSLTFIKGSLAVY